MIASDAHPHRSIVFHVRYFSCVIRDVSVVREEFSVMRLIVLKIFGHLQQHG